MNRQGVGSEECLVCHEDIIGLSTIAPIQYAHSGIHSKILCVTCHDASGLEVGPMGEDGSWTVYRSIILLGRVLTEPYQSHQISNSISCERCHFHDNPWGIQSGEELIVATE
jgi:hypothetical protein